MHLKPLSEEYDLDLDDYLNYGGQGEIFKITRKVDKKQFALK